MNAKIINGLLIFVLTLLAGIYFFFAMELNAEPPNYDQYNYRSSPHPVQQENKKEDLVTQTVNIILAQGFSGAIIICLFGYIWREGKNNRATHQENFDKFVTISGECSAHMAEVSSKLDGIERELEQTKTLEMMKGRG